MYLRPTLHLDPPSTERCFQRSAFKVCLYKSSCLWETRLWETIYYLIYVVMTLRSLWLRFHNCFLYMIILLQALKRYNWRDPEKNVYIEIFVFFEAHGSPLSKLKSPPISALGNSFFYKQHFCWRQQKCCLQKNEFPKVEGRGLFNSETGDHCASKNTIIAKYTFFPGWWL